MEKIIVDVERYRSPIRNWWAGLLLGILFVVMGIVVFMHPGESYFTLSVFFGLMVVVSGIMGIYVGSTMPRRTGRGWFIASGIIEVLLGILLLCLPQVSMWMLPFLLSFWLLLRGFTLIGLAVDMSEYGIKGQGWVIVGAILLILCALLVLFNPVVGVGAIVILLGTGLLLLGISFIILAFYLNKLRRQLR